MDMDSDNARFLRQSLIEHCRKMTPQDRVRAFIEHSRQMRIIRAAGEARRKALELKKNSHA